MLHPGIGCATGRHSEDEQWGPSSGLARANCFPLGEGLASEESVRFGVQRKEARIMTVTRMPILLSNVPDKSLNFLDRDSFASLMVT